MSTPNNLREIRTGLELTICDLAELSGISKGTILRIENNSSCYRTSLEVAQVLAAALYLSVSDIFNVAMLSDLGRPARTGVPLRRKPKVRKTDLCPRCHLTLPCTGQCDYCEDYSAYRSASKHGALMLV